MKLWSLSSLAGRAERYWTAPDALRGAAALLTRLFVGGFFMNTGWGKMHHLEQFAKNFAGWNIPHPYFNAALSAYTEFFGGLLTVVGLATRLVALPMIFNMLVALFAVVLRYNVATFGDFLNTDEPLYLLTYLWLMVAGGGWLSVDGALKLALQARRTRRADPAIASSVQPSRAPSR